MIDWNAVSAVAAVVGLAGGAFGFFWSLRAGRKADTATQAAADAQREATQAQRDAASAQKDIASALKQLTDLQSQREVLWSDPERYEGTGSNGRWRIRNVGNATALGAYLEVIDGVAQSLDDGPVDVEPHSSLSFTAVRSGAGTPTVRIYWTDPFEGYQLQDDKHI